MSRILCISFVVAVAFYTTSGQQCQRINESGVNAADQAVIVNKHNELRQSLARGGVSGQPRACNMRRIQYDQQIAAEAQRIANTCRFGHITVNDQRWFRVGQNLYTTFSSDVQRGADWNTIIQNWFDEYANYRYPDDSNSRNNHYTQIAWANTTLVGCGYTNYESNDGGWRYKKLYVCNYGPGGNIRGNPPYQTMNNGQCGCANLC